MKGSGLGVCLLNCVSTAGGGGVMKSGTGFKEITCCEVEANFSLLLGPRGGHQQNPPTAGTEEVSELGSAAGSR